MLQARVQHRLLCHTPNNCDPGLAQAWSCLRLLSGKSLKQEEMCNETVEEEIEGTEEHRDEDTGSAFTCTRPMACGWTFRLHVKPVPTEPSTHEATGRVHVSYAHCSPVVTQMTQTRPDTTTNRRCSGCTHMHAHVHAYDL